MPQLWSREFAKEPLWGLTAPGSRQGWGTKFSILDIAGALPGKFENHSHHVVNGLILRREAKTQSLPDNVDSRRQAASAVCWQVSFLLGRASELTIGEALASQTTAFAIP